MNFSYANCQFAVGLIAQLIRALHRYRRGHEFESRSSLFDNLHFLVSLVVQLILVFHQGHSFESLSCPLFCNDCKDVFHVSICSSFM